MQSAQARLNLQKYCIAKKVAEVTTACGDQLALHWLRAFPARTTLAA
jgi:hypothetical protein